MEIKIDLFPTFEIKFMAWLAAAATTKHRTWSCALMMTVNLSGWQQQQPAT